MARKSRRQDQTAQVSAPVRAEQRISSAIYARLSVENGGKDDDGESIEMQVEICREYIKGHPEMRLYKVYSDNGRTGTDFDRPGFVEMMADVRIGIVNCIVVKDLSRFGRDYVEAGNYLEKVFPFLGVRFISVTDRYDSLTADVSDAGMMIPLKNMMNAAYAKDISRKIISSVHARQETGDYVPAFPPYGYIKSEEGEHRYVVDPEPAEIIRQIFRMRADGCGITVT